MFLAAMWMAITGSGILFIHGLESSGRGFKATLLRARFPDILAPDFLGPLDERMRRLREILDTRENWTIIGSSYGGLMAALAANENPGRVQRLILLAPALILPQFAARPMRPISVPTIVYHGVHDDLISWIQVRWLCEKAFLNLEFNTVDDDHGLHRTVQALDWDALLGGAMP
jgi:pimeloyl-ACP methyl ester carboxylesterase